MYDSPHKQSPDKRPFLSSPLRMRNAAKAATLTFDPASMPPVSPMRNRASNVHVHLKSDDLSDLLENVLKSPPSLTFSPTKSPANPSPQRLSFPKLNIQSPTQAKLGPSPYSPSSPKVGMLTGPDAVHPSALYQNIAIESASPLARVDGYGLTGSPSPGSRPLLNQSPLAAGSPLKGRSSVDSLGFPKSPLGKSPLGRGGKSSPLAPISPLASSPLTARNRSPLGPGSDRIVPRILRFDVGEDEPEIDRTVPDEEKGVEGFGVGSTEKKEEQQQRLDEAVDEIAKEEKEQTLMIDEADRDAMKDGMIIEGEVAEEESEDVFGGSKLENTRVEEVALEKTSHPEEKPNTVQVPRFYFPREPDLEEKSRQINDLLSEVRNLFRGRKLNDVQFIQVTKACRLPRYISFALFRKIGDLSGNTTDFVTYPDFAHAWPQIAAESIDDVSLVFNILRRGPHLTPDDFLPVMEDIVFNHPGLEFLGDNAIFQERYVETVVCRVFYEARCPSERMNLIQFRRCGFFGKLRRLEHGDDLNITGDFFSYKHFYVIYCKFWELDTDHDLLISEEDLRLYGGCSLTPRIVRRIATGFGKGGTFCGVGGKEEAEITKMSYLDFVWFLLSEVDKSTLTAIEYWFRCMDVDGDGVLSMWELEMFFEEQMARMEFMGMEVVKFEDCLCQMMDLVNTKDQVTLRDLVRCKQAGVFFDMFFNLTRFMAHEHAHHHRRLRKRQLATARRLRGEPIDEGYESFGDGETMSDWEIYAEIEYDNLVSNNEAEISWEFEGCEEGKAEESDGYYDQEGGDVFSV
ncbi:uncharacterized protein VTP21DRAFT_10293 [Calcarisporiella thermophila]|uniref:uncharacterized protein n=1 Tax=Calcarisporiella thermophila TaxID=911321 RepID=UPI003743C198